MLVRLFDTRLRFRIFHDWTDFPSIRLMKSERRLLLAHLVPIGERVLECWWDGGVHRQFKRTQLTLKENYYQHILFILPYFFLNRSLRVGTQYLVHYFLHTRSSPEHFLDIIIYFFVLPIKFTGSLICSITTSISVYVK